MSLINKKEVRNYILDRVKSHRPGWGADRVAASVFDDLNRILQERINRALHSHPSVGKTVKQMQ